MSPAEIAATLRCARALLGDLPIGDAEADPVRELLRKHGLGPLAFRAGAKSFRSDYAVSALLAAQRTKVLGEVVAALRTGGIEVCLLKGVSYAGDLYEDAALRPMGDIDILVRASELGRARARIESLGYRDATPGGATSLHHAVQLMNERWSVDLHRDIVQPWRSRIDVGEVWRRARAAPDVTGALRLDPIDQVLFHCAHIARSELFAPLVAFVDFARLRDRLSDEQRGELVRRARRYGLRRAYLAVEAMADAIERGDARPALPLWGWVLPACDAMVSPELPARPVLLARKAVLNDSWLQLAGLAAVYSVRHLLAFGQRLQR